MEEEWRVITEFPRYGVSNRGRVMTIKTGRILQPSLNQQGHLKVNLMENGEMYTRSINKLVARAFLPPPPRQDFISVIHIDGDKQNCNANNIAWRPRHFAIRYHQQFESPLYHTSMTPVVDTKTGETYASAQQAALANGLIFSEILMAAYQRTFVWPTFQEFRILSD